MVRSTRNTTIWRRLNLDMKRRTEVKSKDPKGRCLYELLDAAFKAWDAGVIRAKDYDAVAHAIIERIPILRKERKIGAYYARRIEEVHRTNIYLVHDVVEFD